MLHNRLRLGVGTKTLLALSLVFWIPVGALSALLYQSMQGMVAEEREQHAKIQLLAGMDMLFAREDQVEAVLRAQANEQSFQTALRQEDHALLTEQLRRTARQFPDLLLLDVIDPDRLVVASMRNQTIDAFSLGSALPQTFQDGQPRQVFEIATAEFLTNIDPGLATSVNDVGLISLVLMPVRQEGVVQAVIVAGHLLTGDPRLADHFLNRFGSEMSLFAGPPRGPMTLHATASLPRSLWSINQPLSQQAWQVIEKNQRFTGLISNENTTRIVAMEPLKDARGRVIGALAVGEDFTPSAQRVLILIGQGVAMTALLALAIALLSVFFVHHDITRPLSRLLNAMDRFGAGELNTRVDLRTGDQLEALGQGFNQMANHIEVREKRFHKHNEVAKLFTSTLDMDELLDRTLRIVVNVTDSQLGVLYLWEEDGAVLMPRAHFGTSDALKPVKQNQGLVGRAACNQKPLIVHPGSDEPEQLTTDLGFEKRTPNEVVYLPLCYQDKLMGVLVLGTAQYYDEDAQQLFAYLTDQIAMALDNANMHRRIQELSITDGLTGLYNRRFLNTKIEAEWQYSQQTGQPLTVLLSDIDNFKSFNDTYGHDRGDIVLKNVAAAFLHEAGKKDLVVRFGGEEFVIIMPNATPAEGQALSERIMQAVYDQEYDWTERRITLSIGVACTLDSPADHFESLVASADQAMYQAKMNGKDRVVIASAENQ